MTFHRWENSNQVNDRILLYTESRYRLTALHAPAHLMISVIHADTVQIQIKENNCGVWKIIAILMRHRGKWIQFYFVVVVVVFNGVISGDEISKSLWFRLCSVLVINVLFVQHLNELIFTAMRQLCATKKRQKLALDLMPKGECLRSVEDAIDLKIYENKNMCWFWVCCDLNHQFLDIKVVISMCCLCGSGSALI